MAIIQHLKAREILDSRGNPTVEVDLVLTDGSYGQVSVPSGASTGSQEAVELRDQDPARYNGLGVLQAVAHVNNELQAALTNREWEQGQIDQAMVELDGTPNKGRLGANAILAVSLAFSHAVARSRGVPLYQYFQELSGTERPILPVPFMNVLNGGKQASNSTDLQEYMLVPAGAPSYKEALRFGAETFHALRDILNERGLPTTVGDEGGFAPPLLSNEVPLKLMVEAIEKAGHVPGKDIYLALDAAATTFYKDGHYQLKREKKKLTSTELIDWYASLVKKYPLISIEDGLAETDWDGFAELTKRMGKTIQIIGDDLFVTNIQFLQKGIGERSANCVLIKPNQIGTLSETLETISLAKRSGFAAMVSHRSGETIDTTITDLAVGTAVGQIKTGSLSRGERIAKYNELLRLEERLGIAAQFASFPIHS